MAARDKAKDDKLFNCALIYELDYVAGLYEENSAVVKYFLQSNCQKGNLKDRTYLEVYNLVKEYLGFEQN